MVNTTSNPTQVAKTDRWELAEVVLPHTRRCLLASPPGTGKSYTAARAGLKTVDGEPQKVYIVYMTEDTPAAELRGHYIPEGDRFVWKDGPAVTAWRQGARLVINEIDKTGGDAEIFMLGLLDDTDTAAITLPTGETVRPYKDFSVVATMNGNPDTDLLPALRDRFPVTINLDSIHPEAVKQLPEDLQTAARNTGLVPDPSRRMSIRLWAEFANLRPIVGESHAAQSIFGERAQQALNALQLARADY
jgi:MoxR-like ATPase